MTANKAMSENESNNTLNFNNMKNYNMLDGDGKPKPEPIPEPVQPPTGPPPRY